MKVNVYKATFEFLGYDGHLKDLDPEEALIAAPTFGAACSLAEEVGKDVLSRRKFAHGTGIRVRDLTLLHAGVDLRKEGP